MDGQDRLFVNMDRCVEQVQKEAKQGLKTAGMKIIASAQRNMRTAGHNGGTLVATGRLRDSGRVEEVPDSDDVEIGFFSEQGARGYAAAVENGSVPHWAPKREINEWVHQKLRVEAKLVPGVGYLIRRAIARKGTRPHPFFGPAVQKHQKDISKAISEAIARVIDKDWK